ncbi:5'-nucleotidase SurE [Veillonella dispar]|uniref:5'-nucleotidase SurE n=1 Tax=Veillonella dispar TaxID=39778 RepID=A0A6N2YLP2_9FIRM
MHILMCNDDGILADGLRRLASYLSQYYRITVVAPANEQSAKSHALTTEIPLKLDAYNGEDENPRLYALTGTPSDCMKFGLSYLLSDDMPDLVISGINHGFNLGSDVLYSGTVSAAMESCFYGIPGLALSVERYSPERGDEMHPFIHELIEKIYVKGNFDGLLNVNFPLRGVCDWDHFKMVSQGLQTYSNIIDARINSRGQDYYWLAGELDYGAESVPTDVEYARKGYITGVALMWKQQCDIGMEAVQNILDKI